MGRPDARIEPYWYQYDRFPEENFGVQEEHHMMENIDGGNSLDELVSRVEDIYNIIDDGLFKFKKN